MPDERTAKPSRAELEKRLSVCCGYRALGFWEKRIAKKAPVPFEYESYALYCPHCKGFYIPSYLFEENLNRMNEAKERAQKSRPERRRVLEAHPGARVIATRHAGGRSMTHADIHSKRASHE